MSLPGPNHDLTGLEENLGYRFRDRGLLVEALTHKSFYHEHRDMASSYNERLEFLGDSVIGLIIVEYLFRLERRYAESVLAKMKSYLVCESVLAEIAGSVCLRDYILLGKGEESSGGREKKSILADALEAVVGAVYLDGGYERTRRMVVDFFRAKIDRAVETGEFYDYKTELQEKTQLLCGTLPEYKVVKQHGKEHKRVFTVAVYLEGKELGVASGSRKKEAEALAAKKALEKWREQDG
ncbi:MAG: ribonuclease III [Candidatus Sulfobium sp.]